MKIFATNLLFLLFIFGCQKDKSQVSVFKKLDVPTTDNLTSVFFLDEKTGFLTGGQTWERGQIFSTTDGGATWKTDTTVSAILENIQFDADGRGYACGVEGRLMTRPPGEKHWKVLREDYVWHNSLFFLNEKLGVVVGGAGWRGGKLMKFSGENFGRDTIIEFENELETVCFSNDSTVHIFGMGLALRSDDFAKTWQRLDVPNDFYRAVHFPTEKTGFACGFSGTILRTDDGGKTWKTLRDGNSVFKSDCPFRAIWFFSEKKGFVAGDGGLFWKTEDGGETWLEIENAPAHADFSKIFMIGNRGWVAAGNGQFFYFEE